MTVKKSPRPGTMLLTLASALFGSATAATAATYYVSPSGNDGNRGTLSAPFQTLNHSVKALAPGDTLFVRRGSYTESLFWTQSLCGGSCPSGTSWETKIRIAAYPGETVWMMPDSSAANVLHFGASQQYVEFDGINLDGSNVWSDIVKIEWCDGNYAHHIRIQNSEVKGSHTSRGRHAQHVLATACDNFPAAGSNEFVNLTVHGHGYTRFDQGFYIQSPNNLVQGCDIYDVPGGGIEIYNGYRGPEFAGGNIIRNNRVHHSTLLGESHRGILIAGNNTFVYNNVIHNLPAANFENNALWVYAGSDNLVAHNTVFANAGYGVVVGYDAAVTNTVVRNNISYQSGQGDYWNRNSAGTIQDHNLFSMNPLFVNAAAADFHLRPGSLAINLGANVYIVATDKDGAERPQGAAPDVGAYEYRALQTSPPEPPSGLRIVTN